MLTLKHFILFCGLVVAVSSSTSLIEVKSEDVCASIEPEFKTEKSTKIFEPVICAKINCLRQKILEGIPSLGISTLDPLKLPLLPIISNNDFLRGRMWLTKFQLEGLAGFKIPKLNVGLDFVFDMGVNFEKLRIMSNYRSKSLNIFNMIDIFGKGNFSLEFNNFDIDIHAELKLLPPSVKVELNLILPTSEAKITGLFYDERMSDIISRQLTATLTALAKQEQERLSKMLSELIESMLNKFLLSSNIDDIKKILQNSDEVGCEPAVVVVVEYVQEMFKSVLDIEDKSILAEDYDKYFYMLEDY